MTISSIFEKRNVFCEIADIQRQINALSSRLDSLKEEAMLEMETKGEKIHLDNNATFTIKDAYVRHDFDKTRFIKEHEDLYNFYIKNTNVKKSMSIKILG